MLNIFPSSTYSLVAVGLVHLLYNALYTGPALHELRATSLITTSLVPLSDTDWLYCGQGRGGRNGRPRRVIDSIFIGQRKKQLLM